MLGLLAVPQDKIHKIFRSAKCGPMTSGGPLSYLNVVCSFKSL